MKSDEFMAGWWSAVNRMSWTCVDCDNRYGPDVDVCPNLVRHGKDVP